MWSLLFVITLFLTSDSILCYLNFEELSSVNYGISIESEPVLLAQELPGGSVTLASKYGQRYQCTYPDTIRAAAEQRVHEEAAREKGFPDLLRPMEAAPCLYHRSGWWTYEFCYGKSIRQFHEDEKQNKVAMTNLGLYESDQEWEREGENRQERTLRFYHAQQYVNGTECSLTQQPRRSEVRFVCEDDQGDYIADVSEPATCVYVVTVHTMKVCHHPYLSRPTTRDPTPITCSPLLAQREYDQYLREQEAAKKKEMLMKQFSTAKDMPSAASPTPIEVAAKRDEDMEREGAVQQMSSNGDDEELIRQFIAGLDGLDKSALMRTYLAQYKNHVSRALSAQFKQIVEAAQLELLKTEQLSEEDKMAAMNELSRVLHLMLAQLDTPSQGLESVESESGRTGDVEETAAAAVAAAAGEGRRGAEEEEGSVGAAGKEAEDAGDEGSDEDGSKPVRQIRVKVVSAGYYDPSDRSIRPQQTTPEDRTKIQHVVIRILGDNQMAREESQRHNAMESQYQRVWHGGKGKDDGEDDSKDKGD